MHDILVNNAGSESPCTYTRTRTCLKYACALTRSGFANRKEDNDSARVRSEHGQSRFSKKTFCWRRNDRAAIHTRGLRCPHNEWSSRHAVNFQCRCTMHLVAEAILTRSFSTFLSFRLVKPLLLSAPSRVAFIHVVISNHVRIIVESFYEFFVSALRVSIWIVFFFFLSYSNSSFPVLFVCKTQNIGIIIFINEILTLQLCKRKK